MLKLQYVGMLLSEIKIKKYKQLLVNIPNYYLSLLYEGKFILLILWTKCSSTTVQILNNYKCDKIHL